MSTESEAKNIPQEALDAFLEGIKDELKSPADPVLLTQIRSAFRKKIPLHLRSYAAALLILRAAGVTRTATASARPQTAPVRQTKTPATAKSPVKASEAPEGSDAASQRPVRSAKIINRLNVPTVPVFVSMGKRQRLRPQELRSLIEEKSGVKSELLGRVHLFDNYSFIDVPEESAEKIISAVNGVQFHNRTLEIKPAKKRSDSTQENEKEIIE
ncbi:MAG: DbpA RNA binding domain-containing protein [Spirochaetia bacterium]|nr:DbpA RNA binding domain-containing protein [Spirochaetia bacterium]